MAVTIVIKSKNLMPIVLLKILRMQNLIRLYVLLLLLGNISSTSATTFTVKDANNETITIDITGVQNINQICNLSTGDCYPSAYTYRRLGPVINFTISTNLHVRGNGCGDSTYFVGRFECKVEKVVGYNKGPYNLPFEAPILKTINKKTINKNTGTVSYTYQYTGKSAIAISVWQLLSGGLSNCPLDTPSQYVNLTFTLLPEPTPAEILYTLQLHPDPDREDIDYLQDENCNSCVPMGLPSYEVNTSTFLPEFKEVDYRYPCRNRPISLERYYTQPIREGNGMFGLGWGMVYESYIQKADITEGISDVSWIHPNGKEEPFYFDGTKFNTSLYHRDALVFDSLNNTYSLKENLTNLTYTFQKSSSDTLKYLLKNIRDNYNNSTSITHNSIDKITAISDACGNNISFTYNAQGLCTKINLPNGKHADFTYDASKRLITNTDVYGNAIQYNYNADNFITSFSVNGNTATFIYATNSLITYIESITNLNGKTTQFSLLPSPPIFSAQRQGSNETATYHSNAYTGSVTKSIRGNTEVNRTFDKNLKIKTRTSAAGVTEHFDYDSLTKNMIRYTNQDGAAYNFTYDAANNLTEVTDPNGQTKKVLYNSNDLITSVKEWDNNWRYYSYNATGLLSSRTDVLGKVSSFQYDNAGNLKKWIQPNGTFSEFTREASTGNLLQYKSPLGGIKSYAFDALNRVTKLTNEDGTFKEYSYNCCSQTGFKNELGHTIAIQRSPTNRILSVTDAIGNATNFSYNTSGKISAATFPNNSTHQLTYTNAGLIAASTNQNGHTVQYQYDTDGNIIGLIDEKGSLASFTNTPSGKLSSSTIPGQGTVQRIYDARGYINAITNARQQFIPITRDAKKRITSVSSDNLTSSYTYNADGNIVAYGSSAGAVNITRDSLDNVKAESWPGFGQGNYTRNANKKITAFDYPGGSVNVKYLRNIRGFITAIIINNTDTVKYTLNNLGDVLGISYPNGVQGITGYDKNRTINAHFYRNANDTLLGFWYQLDNQSNIIGERRIMPNGMGSVIIPSDTGGFFQTGNQVGQWHNNTFTHDADGNVSACSGGLNFTMQHNSVNLPTQLNVGGKQIQLRFNTRSFTDVERSNTNTYFYCYDYRGNMIARKDSATGSTDYFIYDDSKLLAAKTSAGTYYYLTNNIGTTYALTNNTGQLVNKYNYNPWGQITYEQETIKQPFKYVGVYGVREITKDFYLMKHRMYNSYLGRFLEKDPMGYADGTNPYVYAANNPLKYVDPQGLYKNVVGDYVSGAWNRFMNYNHDLVDKYLPKPKSERDYTTKDWTDYDKRLEKVGSICDWIAPWIPGAGAGKAYADGKGWDKVIAEYGIDIALTMLGGKCTDEQIKLLIEGVDKAKNGCGTIDAMVGEQSEDEDSTEPVEALEWEASGRN